MCLRATRGNAPLYTRECTVWELKHYTHKLFYWSSWIVGRSGGTLVGQKWDFVFLGSASFAQSGRVSQSLSERRHLGTSPTVIGLQTKSYLGFRPWAPAPREKSKGSKSQGETSCARRNPITPSLSSGWSPLRPDARRYSGSRFHDPPRKTRPQPCGGPIASLVSALVLRSLSA